MLIWWFIIFLLCFFFFIISICRPVKKKWCAFVSGCVCICTYLDEYFRNRMNSVFFFLWYEVDPHILYIACVCIGPLILPACAITSASRMSDSCIETKLIVAFRHGLAYDLWVSVLMVEKGKPSAKNFALLIFHLQWTLAPSALNI